MLSENSFTMKKERSWRYAIETIRDAEYAYDLAHAPTSVEPLSEQVAEGIDLYTNAEFTESICFQQKGTISTENDTPLKLVDQFM